MRKTARKFAATLALAAPALPFAAPAAAAPGDAAADFLTVNPSPRGGAMGGAYTAVSQDAYSAWWNPAGLALAQKPEAALTHEIGFEGISNQFVAGLYPLAYGRTAGLSFARRSVDGIRGYDASGGYQGNLEASEMALSGHYAQTFFKDEIEKPVFSAGASLRRVTSSLAGAPASALAFDAGALYILRPAQYWRRNVPPPELRAAVTMRNLGSALKYDSQAFPLPQTNTLGLALITHPAAAHTFTLAADFAMSNYAKAAVNAGAEYLMYGLFAMRAGFSTGEAGGLRMGLGYRLAALDVDYSVSPFAELGTVQQVGAVFRFGQGFAARKLTPADSRVTGARMTAAKKKVEALKNYAEDHLKQAEARLKARDYSLAEESMGRAFALEPALKAGPWGLKAARLKALGARLQLRDAPLREKILKKDEEQSVAAGEAVYAYLEGRDLKALLLAQAALGTNTRGDPLFEDILTAISSLTRIPVRREEILPRTALVKEKLKRAAKAFYVQQFDLAAKECEEVILIDEENHMAWTRLGSAWYMTGDKKKSRRAYEKALELKPDDAVTRQFMEAQGWKPKPQEGATP